MSKSVVVKGADVRVYFGGTLYPIQSITWTINHGENEIYGIDSPYPQEIGTGQVSVTGSITGISIKNTGDAQGYGLRPKINEILHGSYISIRVQEREFEKTMLWIPQAKIVSESYVINNKSTAKVNMSFRGIIPYNMLDLDG